MGRDGEESLSSSSLSSRSTVRLNIYLFRRLEGFGVRTSSFISSSLGLVVSHNQSCFNIFIAVCGPWKALAVTVFSPLLEEHHRACWQCVCTSSAIYVRIYIGFVSRWWVCRSRVRGKGSLVRRVVKRPVETRHTDMTRAVCWLLTSHVAFFLLMASWYPSWRQWQDKWKRMAREFCAAFWLQIQRFNK